MARVTVEDCIDKVQNRFELVVYAAQRAKQINSGAAILVDRDNDKDPVVALREIAAGLISPDTLRVALGKTLQNPHNLDQREDENASPEHDTPPEIFNYAGGEIYVNEDHSDLDNNEQMFTEEPIADDEE